VYCNKKLHKNSSLILCILTGVVSSSAAYSFVKFFFEFC